MTVIVLKVLGLWLLFDVLVFLPLWIAFRGGLREEER